MYYDRGFLYQQHEEYDKALLDFNEAIKKGYSNKLVYYRIAETHKNLNNYDEALIAVTSYFEKDTNDIKIHKLKAQILIKQNRYDEALTAYDFVLKNTIDLRPDDIVEFCNIILAINPKNYEDALKIIEFGFDKMGANNFVLRDKKIEYLIATNEVEKVLTEYNYQIENSERKESWYYKKAVYLVSIGNNHHAIIALQQAKISIQLLNPQFQKTPIIKQLIANIKVLEKPLEK